MAQKVAAFLVLFALCSVVWLASKASATATPETLVPKQQASYSQLEALLVEIRDEIRGGRADFRGLIDVGRVQADGAAVLRARCASCHGEERAQDRGDDIVLLLRDGTPRRFSAIDRKAILRVIGDGTMPKGGPPLGAAEKRAIESLLKGQNP